MSNKERLRKLNSSGMEKVNRASSTTQGAFRRAWSRFWSEEHRQNQAAMSCILSHKTN